MGSTAADAVMVPPCMFPRQAQDKHQYHILIDDAQMGATAANAVMLYACMFLKQQCKSLIDIAAEESRQVFTGTQLPEHIDFIGPWCKAGTS